MAASVLLVVWSRITPKAALWVLMVIALVSVDTGPTLPAASMASALKL